MRIAPILVLVGCLAGVPHPARGFSVLAHQAVIDRSWEGSIVPALRQRFPGLSGEALDRARSYAYGGSHIPDLGYFPFGSRLFTDLLHYVRPGEFYASLVEGAQTADEYAFALGALSHYVTDTTGHPEATNPTVAEVYPKLRKKYGPRVTYAQQPSSHIQTEFRFDVLQLSRSKQSPDLVRHSLAFQVAEPVLDRAFLKTYGVPLEDVFKDKSVAIATYRWGFRELLQEATGISWALYKADIQKLDPEATPERFVAKISRADFEKEFGKSFREAGWFAKFFAFLGKLVPNVGPLKRLPYKPLPPDARKRFATALDDATTRYRAAVTRAREHRLRLADENLDVGERTRPGEYPPADEAHAALLKKLDEQRFANVSRSLRADLLAFYAEPHAALAKEDEDDRREILEALERLKATTARD